jgi:hypothetical protein
MREKSNRKIEVLVMIDGRDVITCATVAKRVTTWLRLQPPVDAP